MKDDGTGTTHPLARAAWETFLTAREGLRLALDYMGSQDLRDVRQMRLACMGIAFACDALKAAANAYSNVLGQTGKAQAQEASR